MKLTDVAIVAVEGFSPFHYAVPCMLFGDSVSEIKRFNLHICAERPGLLRARDGFALYATGDYAALEQADIVVVPYWGEVDRRPPQALLQEITGHSSTAYFSSSARVLILSRFIAQNTKSTCFAISSASASASITIMDLTLSGIGSAMCLLSPIACA